MKYAWTDESRKLFATAVMEGINHTLRNPGFPATVKPVTSDDDATIEGWEWSPAINGGGVYDVDPYSIGDGWDYSTDEDGHEQLIINDKQIGAMVDCLRDWGTYDHVTDLLEAEERGNE